MLLDGRVCVVSGAGPGLGRRVALALADQGARLVVAARTAATLDALVAELAPRGAEVLAVPTDITDAAQCRRLADATVERFGTVDVLVNNAFIVDVFEPFATVNLSKWRTIMDNNLFGPLQVTQAVVPHMRAAGGGSVVFVNSMIVRKPRPKEGGYAVAKGALYTAARVLAKELGRDRIRVNSVLPGWMWGPKVEAYVEYKAGQRGIPKAEMVASLTRDIALGEIPTDEEVAGAVVFLASDLSRSVTGQSIDANGGEVFA